MWVEEDYILWLKDQILDHRVDRRGRVLDKHLKGQFSLITALYITKNKVFFDPLSQEFKIWRNIYPW